MTTPQIASRSSCAELDSLPGLDPDQIPGQLVRGGERFVFGIKDDARNVTAHTAVQCYLFNGRTVALADETHDVCTLGESKALLIVPPRFCPFHALHLRRQVQLILQSPDRDSKYQPVTLATVVPPRDLRTQVREPQ